MRVGIVQLVFCLFLSQICFAQGDVREIFGEVTFVTSQNVYVKFSNTEKISIGDTLSLYKENVKYRCLLVKSKSSSSCLCSVIGVQSLQVSDVVVFSRKSGERSEVLVDNDPEEVKKTDVEAKDINSKVSVSGGNVRGRISMASYSNLSSDDNPNHRMMYRLSFNAERINNSKYSLESYVNYRQYLQNEESTFRKRANIFSVYSLALRYDVDPSMSVTVGRKINNKVTSLGAIDGVQVEKYFGKFYAGIVTGFRPDIYTYDFNSDLFEYGGYVGLVSEGLKLYTTTTIGLMQQNNSGDIDREYVYLQHSSTVNRKLSLFSSAELDIYDNVNGVNISNARLTNLYVSGRYRFSRVFDLNLSFDSRKRVLYYESFKSEIERILDDDEARQGLRLRANLRPLKYTVVGLSYSKRFQTSNQNTSDNINGYFSLSKLPSIGGRLSVSLNVNKSNYMQTDVLSIRHSRYLVKQKLYFDLYYRIVNYKYLDLEYFEGRDSKYKQNYYGTSFSYNMNRKLTFTILGELASRESDDYYRINARVIKRFDNKKKSKR